MQKEKQSIIRISATLLCFVFISYLSFVPSRIPLVLHRNVFKNVYVCLELWRAPVILEAWLVGRFENGNPGDRSSMVIGCQR